MHREMLALQLERLPLIDTQIEKLTGMIAQAVKAAPRDGDPTRGSAWFRSGFGAAGNLGSGSTGRHISLSGRVDLLGGNLSGEGGDIRRQPQQPLREGE